VGHICGSAYSPAAAIYLALCTANPGEGATGAAMNEVVNSNNYARKAITFAAGARYILQSGDVIFNQATGSWGTVTHWALVDSGNYGEGNVLAYGSFNSSFAPVAGSAPKVADGVVLISQPAMFQRGITTYLANKMLDLMFRNQPYAQPATYVALLDQTGADDDTTLTTAGKEVAGAGYARALVNKAGGGSPAWQPVSGGLSQSQHDVVFPTVGAGGWSQVVGTCIVDSGDPDSGNCLFYDNTGVAPQTPKEGDVVKLAAGNIQIGLS
jgi:hypothetical protein